MFKQIDSCVSSKVIHNSKKILVTINSSSGKGPHRSQWINSKGLAVTWVLEGKDSLFCFAKWQTSQQDVLLVISISTNCFNNWSLVKEGWPNLECYKSEEEMWLTLVASVVELEGRIEACSKYKPLLSLPRPIMLH